MEDLYMASTFLLIGLILGFVISYRTLYQHYTSPSEYEDYDEPIEDYKSEEEVQEIAKDMVMEQVSTKDNYLLNADIYIDKHVQEENYEEAEKIKILKEDVDVWYDKRRDWFLDSIGSYIYLQSDCECDSCKEATIEGVYIDSRYEALKWFLTENMKTLMGYKYRLSSIR